MTIILLIASFLIASVIVKAIRRIFMKVIGANFMFMNGATQFGIIIIVAFFVYIFLSSI